MCTDPHSFRGCACHGSGLAGARSREPNYAEGTRFSVRCPELDSQTVTRVLLTAFEPYDDWQENASWLALVDLTHWYDGPIEIATRRYPVELGEMSKRLRADLQSDYDLAIHVGQSPGSTTIQLEAVALNMRSDGSTIMTDAPDAYRSPLPLDHASRQMNSAGMPTVVSNHAGTYLCNAALYLSQHYSHSFSMQTKSLFVHLPITPAQSAKQAQQLASMSTPLSSAALAMLIASLAN